MGKRVLERVDLVQLLAQRHHDAVLIRKEHVQLLIDHHVACVHLLQVGACSG